MVKNICEHCGVEFFRNRMRKYCSRLCYHKTPKSQETRDAMSKAGKGKKKPDGHGAKVSAATSGKPKPWVRGELNANYGARQHNRPGVRQKMLDAIAMRGQCWTAETRAAHSETMLGPSNRMRGRRHSAATKASVSAAKLTQYKLGLVKIRTPRISIAEKEIGVFLSDCGLEPECQFHIPGVSYRYDFYIRSLNTILEYFGDYWHFNPEKYTSGSLVKVPRRGPVLVDDVWRRDLDRIEAAIRHGFKIRVVWESEYKSFGIEAVRKVLYETGVPLT